MTSLKVKTKHSSLCQQFRAADDYQTPKLHTLTLQHEKSSWTHENKKLGKVW